MENLNEGMGGSIENEFQDWLDIMLSEKGYEDEIETLKTVIDYAQDTLRDYSIDNWVPQTGGSTNENRKMKDFDLKKYLAEGKLLKEEVSLDAFLKNQLTGIEDETEGIEAVEREEWLDMFGGTKNESGFDDIYNLIKNGKNNHSIDFGDFKVNYGLKLGDDKIIINYKVKK